MIVPMRGGPCVAAAAEMEADETANIMAILGAAAAAAAAAEEGLEGSAETFEAKPTATPRAVAALLPMPGELRLEPRELEAVP